MRDVDGDDEREMRELGRTFVRFMEWAHRQGEQEQSPLTGMVRAHLSGATQDPVVTRRWSAFEQVNLQRAVEKWSAQDGRNTTVQGISVPPRYGDVSLGQVLDGNHLPPVRLSTPDVSDLPSGPGRTHACWNRALLLAQHSGRPCALLVTGPQEHQEPSITIEVAGLPVEAAQAVLSQIELWRAQLNVYRGQTVSASVQETGAVVLTFAPPEVVDRADVVLPQAVVDRIERHAIGISARADQLTSAGQHLKRGLLLYGPPGTGKTHTVRYLLGRRTDATRLLLQGESLRFVGQLTALARELAPSVVILEDVDLVAEDRSYGEVNSVLFELLDAMDGAAADADLLFVLTTNRAEVLERALVQRPGRVDVAVEVGRPDAAARHGLLRLYGAEVLAGVGSEDIERAVDRTDGVTASFLKELIRRAVLTALDGERGSSVTAADLAAAVDDLLDEGQGVTRSLLGLSDDRSDVGLDRTDGESGVAAGGFDGAT